MKFKSVFFLFITSLILFFACNSKRAEIVHDHSASPKASVTDTIQKSILKEEHAMIGNTHFTIKYTAPLVKGRTIWGGLVAYDQVWVTGAHKATTFEIDRAVKIDGKELPAGKYAIFTIPGQENWIFIINRNWDQHLTDEYDQKDDLIRISVKPSLDAPHQERLKYDIEKIGNEAIISVRWEKIKVSVPVQI